MLTHESPLWSHVVPTHDLAVQTLRSASRIALGEDILSVDTGDKASVAGYSLVPDLMFGSTDPAECISAVIADREVFLALVEVIEHGLIAHLSDGGGALPRPLVHHHLPSHPQHSVVHFVLTLTQPVRLACRYSNHIVFEGNVTCISWQLHVFSFLSGQH